MMNTEFSIQENKSISVFDADKFDHWFGIAQKIAASDMIPTRYKNKPMDILIAIDMGNNVGLSMMQSLQSIAVINGTPCVYGDACLAICQSHPHYEWIKEDPILEKSTVVGYQSTIKRRNHPDHTVVFTIQDAEKANLWGKAGPWKQYPSRMMQMRARGFALRNIFPDALKGIQIAEEVQDTHIIEGHITNKSSQSDKVSLLLSKKGRTNEDKNKENNTQNNDTIHNPRIIDSSSGVCNTPGHDEEPAAKNEYDNPMDASRVSDNSPGDKEGQYIKATVEQLDAIDCLIHEKEFKPERVDKAFKHFKVKSFAQMSEEQAEEMIKILSGIEP